MKKLVIVAVAAAALVLGAAAPAAAAPVRSAPATPIRVTVRGEDDTATVHWRAARQGAPVAGWTVAVKPVEQRPGHGVVTLPVNARSHCFESLTPGTTYTFSVRATNKRGSSPAASVRYTVPKVAAPTVSALFGLDTAGNVVRFATDGSTASTVVAPNGDGYTADQQGDVFVPAADGTTIVEYPHDGSASHSVATGLHASPDLRTDDAGDLFWADSVSGAVNRLPVGSSTPAAVPGLGTPGSLWAVSSTGIVATFRHASSGDVLTVRTAAGAVTTRTLTGSGPFPSGRADAMSVEADGDVYIHSWTVGASGYNTWYLLPVGSSTSTKLSDRTAFEIGAVSKDGFVLVESKQWCAAPAEYPTPCAIDRSFSDELVRSGTTTTKYPVTGITAVDRSPVFGVTDDAGDLFGDIPAGPTPGLWRLPAGGGAAQQLSADQFTRLVAA
ncbi:fibronectin type III domain-containing protein [Curtobacterium sp. VKM Ac-2922]|uniref:fibronectin type III domain-containing protein n=1 Tax=Curtobacterium sp. VKM Ac-2922 TaxID=2929475 RepID=UPI001FB39534|nr:fibronectin type III domain-containing protein [Curtobacterium sp. VKM Ac-2922]MCJ1714371.1 fibronectin type III domain-containing protein [Curtobacterium sp. VKM Ac-2922]